MHAQLRHRCSPVHMQCCTAVAICLLLISACGNVENVEANVKTSCKSMHGREKAFAPHKVNRCGSFLTVTAGHLNHSGTPSLAAHTSMRAESIKFLRLRQHEAAQDHEDLPKGSPVQSAVCPVSLGTVVRARHCFVATVNAAFQLNATSCSRWLRLDLL